MYRGVYAVGHVALSHEGRWMAAVLACGEGAVLSHRSAAQLFTLLPAAVETVHVTVPFDRRPKHAGIAVHRSRTLTPAAITARERVPATKPWRTIEDLRRTESPELVRQAIRQADFLGLPLQNISTDRTRSELERLFLALCRRYGLPTPEVNVRIGPHLVDFLFREQRLAVETDGWKAHRGRQAFEDDRVRGLDLLKLGFELVRLSKRQIEDEPALVAVVLRDRLHRAAA
jgi:very-short-patch-repair endonuclease